MNEQIIKSILINIIKIKMTELCTSYANVKHVLLAGLEPRTL